MTSRSGFKSQCPHLRADPLRAAPTAASLKGRPTNVLAMGIFAERKRKEARDPVCGMVVVEESAVGPEETAEGAVWFCSVGCQAQYQSERAEGRGGSRRVEA